MSFMTWNTSLELGIELIDGHHRRLVELVNTAQNMMATGFSHDEMSQLLDELVDYATYHFATEEFWMNRYQYPQVDIHTKEHEDFCVAVIEQELFFDSGKADILPALIDYLTIWLVEHIQKSDGAYGVYARSIGATHLDDDLQQEAVT